MSKNSSFTSTQLFVLLILVTIIVIIIGVATMYVFVEKDSPIVSATHISFATSPINIIPLSTEIPPTEIPLTATLIPTFAYLPTFTPIPSPTAFLVIPVERPTEKPQQVQNDPAPANNPPAANSAPDCSADLEYADAMHKYYLDSIDYIHSPMINYYLTVIDDAIRNRDALSLDQAQGGLDNEKAQVNAEKNSENKRYKAERASIAANCH